MVVVAVAWAMCFRPRAVLLFGGWVRPFVLLERVARVTERVFVAAAGGAASGSILLRLTGMASLSLVEWCYAMV